MIPRDEGMKDHMMEMSIIKRESQEEYLMVLVAKFVPIFPLVSFYNHCTLDFFSYIFSHLNRVYLVLVRVGGGK